MSTGSMLYMLTYFPPIKYTRKGAFEQAEGTEVYGGYIQGTPGQASGPPNSTLFGTPAQNHLGATPAIVEKFLGPCGVNTGDYNLHFRREAADSKAHQPVNDKTIIRVIGNNNWLLWRGPLYVLRQTSVPLIFWQGHWWQFKTPPTPFAVPDAVFQRFLDISGDTQTFSNEPVGVMLPCAGFVKPGTLSAW